MKSFYKVLFLVPAIMLTLLFSCREHAKTPATAKALFGLHIHTYIDTNLVSTGLSASTEYAQEYPDHNGRWMNITCANVYLSNIALHSATTGQWYTIPGSVMLKRMEIEEYPIDSVPVDTYDDLRFTIGLGSALNNGVPSAYNTTTGPDTVLSANETAMYAGPGSGYYFLSFSGYIDTTAGHNNPTHGIPFNYQLAGDTFVVSPPAASGGNSFPIIPNVPGAQYVHIVFDYGKLLQSFPITAPVNQKTILPTPVLDSLPHMIRYECSTPNGIC
jgi:hypothetical protein